VEPLFFATPEEFRAWFAANAASTTELLVGFYRKGSGLPSITWPEAVDEALCVGWIDGVRRGRDDTSYTIRFTPRKPRSIWSAVNIARVAALTAEGRMRPTGLAAFEARAAERSAIYSHEQQEDATLTPEEEAAFRAESGAWDFFNAQRPSYRRPALWWVVSAKRADTRARRLATLIADSAAGKTLGHLTRVAKS
jgi:uncharacterized protein YdeI (YjbR/CyaY-like superfamily)